MMLMSRVRGLLRPAARCFATVAELEPAATAQGEVTVEVDAEQALALEIERRNAEIGVDMTFSEEKHGSVLQFPWSSEQTVGQSVASAAAKSRFWQYWWRHTPAETELNWLYRELHQWCALPDYEGIAALCEPRLAERLSTILRRIHFHGLDVEMEDLRVDSAPTVLDVQLHKNIQIERARNGSAELWKGEKAWGGMGAPFTIWHRTDGQAYEGHDAFDALDENHRPYLVQMTVLFQSPMRLVVWNQNRSRVLFGGEQEGPVKNIAQFEIKLKGSELMSLLPVNNKKLRTHDWKMTDFNGLMDGNPFFLN